MCEMVRSVSIVRPKVHRFRRVLLFNQLVVCDIRTLRTIIGTWIFAKTGLLMAYPCRTCENRASGSWLGLVRCVAYGGICLLVFVTQACHKTSPPAPVKTLTLMDQTWVSRDYQRRLTGELALFERQTGIRVDFLPAAETTTEQYRSDI
jgi:hypothetical protein